ncbi:ftz-f1, partial [Trypoxylus dichotomus]
MFYLWNRPSHSDVRGIANRKHVEEGYEQVQRALLEYTLTGYPQIQ